jgi:hypothetical protein
MRELNPLVITNKIKLYTGAEFVVNEEKRHYQTIKLEKARKEKEKPVSTGCCL